MPCGGLAQTGCKRPTDDGDDDDDDYDYEDRRAKNGAVESFQSAHLGEDAQLAVRLWTRTEKIDSGSKRHSHFCIWARQAHGHVKVRLVPGEGGNVGRGELGKRSAARKFSAASACANEMRQAPSHGVHSFSKPLS
jgi:hypothetical protein